MFREEAYDDLNHFQKKCLALIATKELSDIFLEFFDLHTFEEDSPIVFPQEPIDLNVVQEVC